MSILCLGGSFNPIHHGHLISAIRAAEHLKFDRIALIPSGVPPHKQQVRDLAAAEHRLAMTRLAVEGSPLFEVLDLEINGPQPSYTIQTVRRLKSLGATAISWLVGADQLPLLPQWHLAGALLEEAQLVVLRRPGYAIDWQALPPKFRVLKEHVVETPQLDISSSAIRQRVADGLPIDYLTPAGVVAYVHHHRLYRREIKS